MYGHLAAFETDSKDEAIFDANGDIVMPPCKETALFLNSSLSERGFTCTKPTECEGLGWAFYVSLPHARVWCLLHQSTSRLLLAKPEPRILDRLFQFRRARAGYRDVLEALHHILAESDRVTKLRWYSHKEYERDANGPGRAVPWE